VASIKETLDNNSSLSERAKEFYQLVGQCITAWATVEGKLFEICELLLKTDRAFVSVIFYRTTMISARINLTEDLLEIRFPPTRKNNKQVDHAVFAEWKCIVKRMNDLELSKKRNSLAHHPVIMNIDKTDKIPAMPGSQILRSTHSFETATSQSEKARGKPSRRIPDSELLQLLTDTNSISESLTAFISGPLREALL
jgi:hypothetical protein